MKKTMENSIGEVEKILSDDEIRIYSTHCDCGQECMTLEIFKDKRIDKKDIFINLHYDMIHYCNHNFEYAEWYEIWKKFAMLFFRIKSAIKLLLTGHLKLEGEFIFRGRNHINAFIKALESSKEIK